MSSNPRSPLFHSDDPTELRELISKLRENGYQVRRPTGHQIKVGPVNYYHSTGRITIDPCAVHKERGAQAFLDLIVAVNGKTNTHSSR